MILWIFNVDVGFIFWVYNSSSTKKAKNSWFFKAKRCDQTHTKHS